MSEETKPLIVLNLKTYKNATGDKAEDSQEAFKGLIGVK